MTETIAYCGTPPLPGELIGRFNGDPTLMIALAALAAVHLLAVRRDGTRAILAASGWCVVAVALLSPLCALSVALFAARATQHMILTLVAAPLIAMALRPARTALWTPTIAFFVTLWFWHMPAPYEATFHSDAIYWAMHLTLFGSAVWLWCALLQHDRHSAAGGLAAGLVTAMQMGLLGALLTLSNRSWFAVHSFTTQPWGMSPITDQQLGGVLMWVPGCLFFLWAGIRSSRLAWDALEPARG